jgi:hypothetical protein
VCAQCRASFLHLRSSLNRSIDHRLLMLVLYFYGTLYKRQYVY